MQRLSLALLALLALSAAGRVARAQDVPVTGACATPDSIAFRGNQRISDALVRGDAGIAPGVPLNYRTLQRAIKQLYATSQFDEVSVVCEPATAGGKTILAFVLRERPILTDVSVSGPDRISPNSVKD
ncbi:MAG: POTRA domain-containing protein, partial [Gemmatimonadales bacterium]